ncbi:hypothetical protein WA026_015288 [Henosepilachna vigintioctopunctata]|uniref:Uncharacterized protein n=1 Tax=Henosepilachna vigintioctopunctata TaxID=420089 RepID=A0AAW1TTM7_9CUCU
MQSLFRDCRGEYGNCNMDNIIFLKELEWLTREREFSNKYVAELEFSRDLLKEKYTRERESELKQTTSANLGHKTFAAAAAGTKSIEVYIDNKVEQFPLIVRTTDPALSNTMVGNIVKSKVTPGAINANSVDTKLLKTGLLIN